jgi:hypothetical protein
MQPAQPPAEDVDELLERLRQAREELTEAGRVVHLLSTVNEPLEGHALRRQLIESIVAERRCELWANAIVMLERRARSLGLQP